MSRFAGYPAVHISWISGQLFQANPSLFGILHIFRSAASLCTYLPFTLSQSHGITFFLVCMSKKGNITFFVWLKIFYFLFTLDVPSNIVTFFTSNIYGLHILRNCRCVMLEVFLSIFLSARLSICSFISHIFVCLSVSLFPYLLVTSLLRTFCP